MRMFLLKKCFEEKKFKIELPAFVSQAGFAGKGNTQGMLFLESVPFLHAWIDLYGK